GQAHEDLTQSKLRAWCERHFLSFLRMREWRELHRQLRLACTGLGWSEGEAAIEVDALRAPTPERGRNRPDPRYALLHRALIAGLPTQVGHRGEKGQYEGP